MDGPNVTRSKARSRTPDWLRGALWVFGSVVVAIAFQSTDDGRGDKVPVRVLVGEAAVLVLGGVLAAREVGPARSPWRFLACMLMPAPTVLPLFVIMVGLTPYEEFLPEVYWVTFWLVALLEVPLVVTLLVLGVIDQRRLAALGPSAPPPLDRDLNAATRGGRSPTVIREYIDNEDGQTRLDADTAALLPYGYGLVSVDTTPPKEGILQDLEPLRNVLSLVTPIPDTDPDDDYGRILATFGKGASHRTPTPLGRRLRGVGLARLKGRRGPGRGC